MQTKVVAVARKTDKSTTLFNMKGIPLVEHCVLLYVSMGHCVYNCILCAWYVQCMLCVMCSVCHVECVYCV